MLKRGSTFAVIKPRATRKHLVDILRDIHQLGFIIARLELRRLKASEAEFLYEEHKGQDFYEPLIQYMISDNVVLLHLMERNAKIDAVSRWRLAVKGVAFRPDLGEDERLLYPNPTITLRQKYGNPDVPRENALHASDSHAAAERELNYFRK